MDLFVAINLTRKLNYKIEDQKERMELVKNLLQNKKNDLNDYFDQRFNVHPLSGEHGDKLSDKDKVCQQLDKIANYILCGKESEEQIKKRKEKEKEKDEEKVYNFYTEKQLIKKIKKDKNNSYTVENINVNSTGESKKLDFFKGKGINFKKEIKQYIFDDDYLDSDFKNNMLIIEKDGELELVKEEIKTNTLKEYQDYIMNLKRILDDLRVKKKNNKLQYKIKETMKDCKITQIITKDKIKGTIYFKNILPDSTDIDYDQFDFFDIEHVKCLLKFEPRKLTTDLGILIYDLNQLLTKVNLTEQDKNILQMWRDDNLTQDDIAKLLKISPPYVSSTLNRIADKVTKVFEAVYEDYYYLNLVKGKYKKCPKCNKIKLSTKFGKDNRNIGGLKSYCKVCENNLKMEKSNE